MSYDSTPATPLVAASSNDQVPGSLVNEPNSKVNFAADPKAKAWLLEHVQPLLQYVRDDSEAQRDEWAKIRRMGNLIRDETAAYDGQSQAYLPVYQKARETRVSHISRGLFPSDTYIDVTAQNPQLENLAPVARAWMMEQLERRMKIRAELKPFLRSLTDYGLAIGKVWWEKPIAPIKRTRMARLPGINSVLLNYGEADPWSCEGARFKPRSVFSWYVWPTSVNSIDEASLVFEDIQVSKQWADEMVRKGVWQNAEEVLLGDRIPSANSQLQEQLDETHHSSNTAVDVQLGDLATWAFVTECWLRMPIPDSLYQPNEEKGSPVPVKVVFAGGTPVEARRNPFWHQKPPYVMQRMNETIDSFFSPGMGRSMLSLQSIINDFANQTNDNGIYGLNPVVKYNPNLIVGPIEPMAPGRMFPMTDPNGMVFDRPPVEQLQYGLMLTNQYISYANDLSGVPAVLQGSGSKGGAKTATGAQLLQNNVKGELQDLIEEIELRVLMPVMDIVHSLGQQYESAERWLAITGGEKLQFTRDMLEGEYLWRWVASSQVQNQAMRAQASIQFAQLAAQMTPILQMQGKSFNPEPVLRRIWEDGLGQRNFDRVVTSMPMQPGMPGMGGPPGQPGTGAPGEEPRSATEQAPGGGEMAQGEGEAFGEVRSGADDLAATIGAMGGVNE